jgi:hypothetical protein
MANRQRQNPPVNMYASDIAADFGKSTAKEIAADKQSWQGGEGWSEAQFFGNPERGYEATGGLKEGWKLGLDGIPYNAALGGLLGGLGRGRGGSGNNVGYAWDDYNRQMSLLDKIGEMSAGYSTYGTLGDTVVDYAGKKITQTLSPALQAQYDALLGGATASRARAAAMGADPYEMQQYLYDQNLALKRPAQEQLRAQTQEALAAKGMLGSTGGAGLYGQVEESIQRSNAQDFADAMAQSQQMLDLERARGQQDLATATAMGGLQIPFMESGRAYGQGTRIGNVEGVSGASANIANQLATRDYGKKKGLWDMLGGGGLGGGGGGGLFGSLLSGIFT